jgi:hypothetical protein
MELDKPFVCALDGSIISPGSSPSTALADASVDITLGQIHSMFVGKVARVTGLEPATSGVTGRRSNRLSYTRVFGVGGT